MEEERVKERGREAEREKNEEAKGGRRREKEMGDSKGREEQRGKSQRLDFLGLAPQLYSLKHFIFSKLLTLLRT